MKPYVEDADLALYRGDAAEVLASLPEGSVHCVVTSPPYYGLRDYGTGSWEGGDPEHDHAPVEGRGTHAGDRASTTHVAGSPSRGGDPTRCACGARRVDRQLGLEATPTEYVARMVAVFREVRRVLRPDGTLWLNLGDSYSSVPAGNTPGDFSTSSLTNPARQESTRARTRIPGMGAPSRPPGIPGVKPKDLLGIPWSVAFALRDDGWYLRSEIVWSKTNVMPESVRDRPTKSHEQVFLLTSSPSYFYDGDAIREDLAASSLSDRRVLTGLPRGEERERNRGGRTDGFSKCPSGLADPNAGRNARSVWSIPTESYDGAHFAVMAREVARRCILAGTPEDGVCQACGAPRRRLVEKGEPQLQEGTWSGAGAAQYEADDGRYVPADEASTLKHVVPRKTVGWKASCACDAGIVPAVVLDPFAGAGTTALVARELGRRSVGIELSKEFCALAAERTAQLPLLGTWQNEGAGVPSPHA